jgi:hypothetical protein
LVVLVVLVAAEIFAVFIVSTVLAWRRHCLLKK